MNIVRTFLYKTQTIQDYNPELYSHNLWIFNNGYLPQTLKEKSTLHLIQISGVSDFMNAFKRQLTEPWLGLNTMFANKYKNMI